MSVVLFFSTWNGPKDLASSDDTYTPGYMDPSKTMVKSLRKLIATILAVAMYDIGRCCECFVSPQPCQNTHKSLSAGSGSSMLGVVSSSTDDDDVVVKVDDKHNDNVSIEVSDGPPFINALWGIASNGSPWEYMLRMVENEYANDDIVPVNLGPLGIYNFLLSPEAVRSATVEESSCLSRRFSVPLFETLELDKGLVYEQGERHKRHKRLCIPSFEQTQSMESFVDATRIELNSLSNKFTTIIEDDKNNNNIIDLYSEMRRSTLNVVLDVTFGLGSEMATSYDRADLLSKTIGEYLERIVALANEIPPLWQISPRLSGNYRRVTDTLLPTLRTLVAEVISKRRVEEEEEASASIGSTTTTTAKRKGRADLLGVLVEDDRLTDSDIRSILFDVVIAGSDTTASTTTAAMYVLHEPKNIKWLELARDEAIRVNAGEGIELSSIQKQMPVATSVAREILRLYPPVPFVGRTATKRGDLLDGSYPVKIDDTFCFSPWFLGRDPRAWSSSLEGGSSSSSSSSSSSNSNDRSLIEKRRNRAEEFDPQRWIDDPFNGGASSNFSWLPFGAGARGCLGTRLGLTEVTLGISRLLKDFTFDFETTGPLPVKYDLTLNLDDVMKCQIQKR